MFKQIIKSFLSAKRPLLGRWCLNDKTKNHLKIDMANIDHCGTCTFAKEKTNVVKQHVQEKKKD